MYFFPRLLGNVGPTGIPGPVGPSGPRGDGGAEGQALSGVTYNRWGRTNCSGDASVVYTGMRITSTYIYKGAHYQGRSRAPCSRASPITRSEQLPYWACNMAFLQTGLF